MISERKLANALSGKTARACDSCSRKRARWFCAADDAFLCQSCDESVHSANQLARRHERVRLETASFKPSDSIDSSPAWHQGFTRKSRTPRPNNNNNKSTYKQHHTDENKVLNSTNSNNNSHLLLPLVPEIGSEEEGNSIFADEHDDQLLYRVPVFDPFAAELCVDDMEGKETTIGNEENMFFDGCYGQEKEGSCEMDDLSAGFLPSDMDLAEFAADVENLIATGLDDDSPDIKDLGLLEFCDDNKDQENNDHKVLIRVKDEQERDSISFDHMARESLMDWSFNYESPMTGGEEEEEKVVPVADKGAVISYSEEHKKEIKRNVSLRLNYEAVITAWASHGSPWTTGSRPTELNPDDCWPDCMGTCPKEGYGRHQYGGHTGSGKGGREARVLRYKEKRRTRLFSKKIRYDVRKLNAEKRPRMKGRFVKREAPHHGINCFSLHQQI